MNIASSIRQEIWRILKAHGDVYGESNLLECRHDGLQWKIYFNARDLTAVRTTDWTHKTWPYADPKLFDKVSNFVA